MSEETEKIYNSVHDILNKQIEKYNGFIQNNKDYIDLKDSPDQWLKQDDAYMAAALRNAAKFSYKTTSDQSNINELNINESNTNELNTNQLNANQLNANESNYTLNDLTVMSTYVKESANQLNGYGIRVPYVDEETLGIQLAFQAMKVETLANKSGITNNMSQTIKQSINRYSEEMIKHMQEVETKCRDNPKFPEDYYRLGALDESAIENTYDYVMELYYKKDVATALSSGLEYGRRIFQNKCKDENYNVNYRYDETKNIQWTYLTNGPEGYFHGSSTLESYISNWNSFIEDLTSGNSENINLYFDKRIGVGSLTWPKYLVDIYA